MKRGESNFQRLCCVFPARKAVSLNLILELVEALLKIPDKKDQDITEVYYFVLGQGVTAIIVK